MSTRLSKTQWSDLLNKYGSAMSIARATAMKYQTIYWNLKRLGLVVSEKAKSFHRGRTLNNEEVMNKYNEFNSLRLTADYFNVDAKTIRKHIPKNILEKNACVKYECNENFFLQDNEASFYWAGFIMADGCVKLKDKKYKQLSIGLALSDINHLEKFKQQIDFKGQLFSGEYDGLGRCEVTISSNNIFDSLVKFGVVPRKSLIAKFPKSLISHPLVHHFLRGYFDGDGSIYTSDIRNNGHLTYYFSTRGTPEFLEVYRSLLENNSSIKKRTKPIRVSSGQGVLEYGGNKIMLSIRDFLYKDATIWLDRKHDKFFAPELKLYPKGESLKLLHGMPSPKRKPIYGMGSDGQRIDFPAATLINKDTGFDKSCIMDCLKGRAKQHKGFTWHYV